MAKKTSGLKLYVVLTSVDGGEEFIDSMDYDVWETKAPAVEQRDSLRESVPKDLKEKFRVAVFKEVKRG